MESEECCRLIILSNDFVNSASGMNIKCNRKSRVRLLYSDPVVFYNVYMFLMGPNTFPNTCKRRDNRLPASHTFGSCYGTIYLKLPVCFCIKPFGGGEREGHKIALKIFLHNIQFYCIKHYLHCIICNFKFKKCKCCKSPLKF